MTSITHSFFWSTVYALSPNKRLFIASGDFQTHIPQLLSQTSLPKEVICLSNDFVYEGVKTQSDYAGRPWKNIIVDPEGVMPLADVKRLLVKNGLYLCTKQRKWGRNLPYVQPMCATQFKSGILRLGDQNPTWISHEKRPKFRGKDQEVSTTDPLFYIASKEALTDPLPSFELLNSVDSSSTEEAAQPSTKATKIRSTRSAKTAKTAKTTPASDTEKSTTSTSSKASRSASTSETTKAKTASSAPKKKAPVKRTRKAVAQNLAASVPPVKEASSNGSQDELNQLQSLCEQLKEKVADLEKSKRTLSRNQNQLTKKFEQSQTRAEQLNLDLETAQNQLESLHETHQETLSTLQDEHTELVETYRQVKAKNSSLENTLKQVQTQASQAKKEARSQKKSLEKELEKAHKRTQKTQDQLDARIDSKKQLKQSRKETQEAKKAFALIAQAWSEWLSKGLEGDLPALPPAQTALARSWAQQLVNRQPLVSATRDEYQELVRVQTELQNARHQITLLEEERDEVRVQFAQWRDEVPKESESTLEQNYLAEKALRQAIEQKCADYENRFAIYESERAELQNALDLARRNALTSTSTSDPSLEAENHKLQTELNIRNQQRTALEQLLQAQQEMQAQLTQNLSTHISARSEAEYRVHLLESELRLLKVNYQRLEQGQSALQTDSFVDEVTVDTRTQKTTVSSVRSQPTPVSQPTRTPEQGKQRSKRLSRLKDQLKTTVQRQTQTVQETQKTQNDFSTLKLRSSSKQDQKRIKQTANRLKESVPPQAQPPVVEDVNPSTSPVHSKPALSDEEKRAHSQRANAHLREKLNRLSRKRS